MAKITVMSYLDVGAPQIIANNRTAFYTLLDTWLVDGYNPRVASQLLCDNDLRTVTLKFESDHGYKFGHLIEIQNANNPAFNQKLRVIEAKNREITLRLDKADTTQYPAVDDNTFINVRVSPANWELSYSSEDQRTYKSRADRERSSQLYYTFKKPVNPKLQNAGAVCYSVDISKELDTVSGASLNSIFYNDTSTTDGTNWYVLTDVYTTPLTHSNNGKGNTYLPWFCIASDTFVYFMLGSLTSQTSTTATDPKLFYSQYRNYPRHQDYYTTCQVYFFGDFEPFHPQETLNQTSSCFSFYYFKEGVVESTSTSMLYRYPGYFHPVIDSPNDYHYNVYLVDSFVPSNTPTRMLTATPSLLSSTASSYSSGHAYLPIPTQQQNLEGLFESKYYAVQTNNSSYSSELKRQGTVVRGLMPFGVYIYQPIRSLINFKTQEFAPLRFFTKDPIWDDIYVVGVGSTSTTEYPVNPTANVGYSTFKVD